MDTLHLAPGAPQEHRDKQAPSRFATGALELGKG